MKNFFKDLVDHFKKFDEGIRFGEPKNIEILTIDNPRVEFYKDNEKVKVRFVDYCSVVFKTKCASHKFFSEIPKGFDSDGASIPQVFRSYLSPWEIVFSAFFHDSWYARNNIFVLDGNKKSKVFYSRTDADNLFYAIMKYNKVPYEKRLGAYLAVRSEGGSHWEDRNG